MTNLNELKKILEYSQATQASEKFSNLREDGGPRGFNPNSLKGLTELKTRTSKGKIAIEAKINNII